MTTLPRPVITPAMVRNAARVAFAGPLRPWVVVGTAGSVAISVASYAVGALPVHAPLTGWPLVEAARHHAWVPTVLAYAGLAALVVAWLRIGLLLGAIRESPLPRDARPGVRALLLVLACWVGPLLVAMPLYSRDVYSYLAQGHMFGTWEDPYSFGPASIGGDLAANVSPIWRYTTAPYGPLFLAVAGGVMRAVHSGIVPGIALLRLVTVLAVAALAWIVPHLARKSGADPARGLWLGVLNPLVLAHLVAGIHNDAFMIVLMLAGMLAGHFGRHLVSGVLIGLAALVKAPVLVALPFLVLAARRPWRAGVSLATGTAAAMVGITAAMGTWYGWVAAIGGSAKVHNGLSLVTDVGDGLRLLAEALGIDPGLDPVVITRGAGAVLAVAIIARLLTRHRVRPVLGIGLAMAAVLVMAPVLHPWYLLWAVVPLASSTLSRAGVRLTAAIVALMAFYPSPHGGAPDLPALLGLVAAAGTAAALWRYADRVEALLAPGVDEAPVRPAVPASR